MSVAQEINTPREEPDAWIILHRRATDACYFGPFSSREEAAAWREENRDVRGFLIPVWRKVDWNRAGC